MSGQAGRGVKSPEAVIFGRQDIRWCGNEAGQTREVEWNVIPYQENPNQMNHNSWILMIINLTNDRFRS